MRISNNINQTLANFKQAVNFEKNFDIVLREFDMGSQKCAMFALDGEMNGEVLTHIFKTLMEIKSTKPLTADEIDKKIIPYIEVNSVDKIEDAANGMFVGSAILFVDGVEKAFSIDAKSFPQDKSLQPEKDKSIRGSRDGFSAIPIFNAALIRRRIHSKALSMEKFSVGRESGSDVVVCYMEGLCNVKLLEEIKHKISTLDIQGLTMNQETLAENIFPTKWYNPYPRVRYCERPDEASAALLEGKIVLIIDNAPAVMILPVQMIDFVREANDYYFPPITGTYYRFIKYALMFLSLFLTPVWLVILKNIDNLPEWFRIFELNENTAVPVAVQLIIMEFVLEIIRISTMNTPNVLGSSIGIVGALLVGEFAVSSGWLASETVFYMSFLAISMYASPNFEYGYATKFLRIMLVILTGLFDEIGLIAGTIMIFLLMISTKTVDGKSYLYPIIPFDWAELKKYSIRNRLNR